jgi:hypothetical protein
MVPKKTPQFTEDKHVVPVPSVQNIKAYWVVEVKLLVLISIMKQT